MQFEELVKGSRKGETPYQGTLLALDPGQTTGWCVFHDLELKEWGELQTPELNLAVKRSIERLFDTYQPTHLVCEDYRVYKWRAQHHANSSLHTAKLIGIIEAICFDRNLVAQMQMAVVAKGFATDDALEEWGWYKPSQRHARDAIRHACYFITFGPKSEWTKRPGRKITVG